MTPSKTEKKKYNLESDVGKICIWLHVQVAQIHLAKSVELQTGTQNTNNLKKN